MEIIGIVLFCAVILASAKLMLDLPDRKKIRGKIRADGILGSMEEKT